MEVRAELERLLSKEPQTAEEAERMSEAASLLAAHIRLEDRLKALLAGTSQPKPTPGVGSSRPATLLVAAERVLEEAGTPLHVRVLGPRIKASGWNHPRSRDPQGTLIYHQLAARLPQHPDTFERVAPNTFGLTKWRQSPPGQSSPRPRVGIFAGPGHSIGRETADSEEALTAEQAGWRSS